MSDRMLRDRLLATLAGSRPPADLVREARLGVHGDVPAGLMRPEQPRPAAVLVPVVDRADGPGLMLTRRTDHLPDHPGQICFPGGSFEAQDADAVSAALREMQEEVGIGPAGIRVEGFLPPYLTITGFAVAPVVGLLQPDYQTAPDPFEVAEVFEVPLAHALDPDQHQVVDVTVRGQALSYYQIDWQGYRIWGATAAMIVGLSRMMREQ
ncbi:CoA pyrophosphatase [Gammaproteobacteria bacterium AB-CW1]|uniref:CoA pyrophosphatase n=2 Tax=Natronospira TaxID=2024969 RepID=A0AAP6JHZ6_9GAMM|nr:CoA pyrophosphatase [Gammaproteobacteria bacterium AB-CW1]